MYIFIYRKNDVKKMYNFVISFIFRYWGKAPPPKKGHDFVRIQENTTWTFDLLIYPEF